MGLFLSSGSSHLFLLSIFFPFFCSASPRAFFRPAYGFLEPARAGAVKVGRRASLYTHTALARPHLDGAEHGGILSAIGRLA